MPDDSHLLTWRELWNETTEKCGDRITARWLCEHASGAERDEFDDILGERATTRCVAHLDAMMQRLSTGEPLQYVMGRWAFRHLDVLVDARVLIPRPETELLVDIVLQHCSTRSRGDGKFLIADVGTGSGVIGLSILAEMPMDAVEVWMTDISEEAIHVARANAAGIGRAATHARFSVGNWCEALPDEALRRFDVIASNPPYIALDDAHIETSVRAWEPHGALFSGDDGLDDMRVLVGQAPRWLKPAGLLVVEMGHQQAHDVQKIFHEAGFVDVVLHRDLAGLDRFVSGIAPH